MKEKILNIKTNSEKVWCFYCDKFVDMDKAISVGEIGNGKVVCNFPCFKKYLKTEVK